MRPWRVTCAEHSREPAEGCDHCRLAFVLDIGGKMTWVGPETLHVQSLTVGVIDAGLEASGARR